MEELIQKRIEEHKETILNFNSDLQLKIKQISEIIIKAYQSKNKVIFFGNGGSCADSQHLATELVARYYLDRPSLPAIALTDNVSITAIGNDYSFDDIFKKQLEGHSKPGDVIIAISTSGTSPNIIKAVDRAVELNLTTIAFTGQSGGQLKDKVDICLNIPSNDTPRIQEGYMLAGHIICEIVEKELFAK
tara:strand:- start:7247 stop:7816 length:570 start_codon:yes stop_codon:yes gene_type:complete